MKVFFIEYGSIHHSFQFGFYFLLYFTCPSRMGWKQIQTEMICIKQVFRVPNGLIIMQKKKKNNKN